MSTPSATAARTKSSMMQVRIAITHPVMPLMGIAAAIRLPCSPAIMPASGSWNRASGRLPSAAR